MPTAITTALILAAGGIIAALIAWHSTTATARASRVNAAQEAADRALASARDETQREREELLELRDKRLEEMANQLGAARVALAEERQRAAARQAEIDQLRAEIADLRTTQPEGHGGTP